MSISTVGTLMPTSKKNTKLKVVEESKKLSFTFLNRYQVYDDKLKLDIIKKYGVESENTDLAKHFLPFGYKSCCWFTSDITSHYDKNTPVTYLVGDEIYKNFESIYMTTYMTYGSIRPVLDYNVLCSDLFREHVKVINVDENVLEIEFGEFPQIAVDIELHNKLESNYNKHKLEKTGKKYHFMSLLDFLEKYLSLITSKNEYIFEGKKYIRLVDDIAYIVPTWFEVQPIRWYVDLETNVVLSKKCLLAGVEYNNYRNKKVDKTLKFEDTTIKKFMDKYLARDIIPSKIKSKKQAELTLLDEKLKEEINENNQKVETFVEQLIDKIDKLLKFVKDDNYIQNTINKVDKLLDEYNCNLDNLNNNKILVTSDETPEGLKKKVMVELSLILDGIKKVIERTSKYYEMLEYINDLKKILSHEEIEKDTDLKNDFDSIYRAIMFLDENKQSLILDEIINILNKENEKIDKNIKEIINSSNEMLVYENVNEFELSIRKQIHPILISLNEKVLKHDVSKRIIEGTREIIKNNYQQDKSSIINYYINLMNELYQEINKKYILTEEETALLLNIIKTNIDTEKNINDIIRQLTDVIKKLCVFKLDLKEKREKEDIIEKSYIKRRLKDRKE